MEDKRNTLRNIVIVLGLVIGLAIALVVRANLPEGMARFSGLIFFGIIIAVTLLFGFIAGKFVK